LLERRPALMVAAIADALNISDKRAKSVVDIAA
jgi:hypothetical protein